MYIACPECSRQYEVSHQAPGSTLRCRCDHVFEVCVPESHAPRPVRCAGCAAPLNLEASSCGYCGCEVTLDEKRLGEVCPSCFARMAKDASYCMECGVEVRPQALAAIPDKACPRCQGVLGNRCVGDTSVVECTSCAGLWFTPETFEDLCARAEAGDRSVSVFNTPSTAQTTGMNSAVTYLPCLSCDDLMIRRNYGQSSGVIIDVCGKHGVWLDHREIEKILAFIQQGGLMNTRRREVARLEADARRARNEVNVGSPSLGGGSMVLDGGGPDLADALRWVAGLFRG